MSVKVVTPIRSIAGGVSVGGATTRTSLPSKVSARMFERATRLCSTSPQIAIGQPLDLALAAADGERVEQGLRRMFVAAVAGVEHGAVDLVGDQLDRARAVWRITITSARIALSVIAVSISVSPFFTLDCAACMLTTSAPRRFPAISNDSRVRVEFSKKALMIVRPAS
jgi:hypothetical protein